MNSETSAAPGTAELVPQDQQPGALATASDNPIFAMVEAVERLATNPDVTPDKINMILDAQERILDRQAKMAYTQAMAQFREKCPEIIKDQAVGYAAKGGNVSYRHASLASTLKQVQVLMHECGLSHSWRTEQPQPGFVATTCIVTHCDGHSEQTSLTLPYDTSGSKNAIQAVGSAQSYGQRYTLFSMLGLASAPDDDGMTGAPTPPQPLSKARKAQQARQAGPGPDQQRQPQQQPEPPNEPPAQQEPAPPQAQNGQNGSISQEEKTKRKKFTSVCNALAEACQVVQPGQSLDSRDFWALLGQAQAMAGSDDLVEATSYIMGSARAIVKDANGIRLIPND